MPEQVQQTEEELQNGPQQGQEGQQGKTQQQIDWENDQNPYRKRYQDSQGQIQPLVRTLNQFAEYDHTTKQWKPKQQQTQQQEVQPDKLLEGYDPEFVKALNGYVAPMKNELAELRKEREQSAFMTNYNAGVSSARSKAIEEFGGEFDFSKNGKFNTDSPLYKMANEILTTKYAQFNPDGTFHRYSSPDAEYMATVEAYAVLARRAKQPQQEKGKFNAIQGKGSKASGVKSRLSYEEYSKLSNDDKDAYDMAQIG